MSNTSAALKIHRAGRNLWRGFAYTAALLAVVLVGTASLVGPTTVATEQPPGSIDAPGIGMQPSADATEDEFVPIL